MFIKSFIKSVDEDKFLEMTGLNGYYQMFECDLEDTAIGPKWNEWVKGLENYLKWLNVSDDERKKAALLHHAGVEVMRIYEAVEKNPRTEGDASEKIDTFAEMKQKLANHFNPRKNRFYEKHTFRQARQEDGESIASFATRLRNLAKYCGFANVEDKIISQIVEGTNNKDVIGKVLRSSDDLKLEELLDWGRTREVANHQINDIRKTAENSLSVNKLSGEKTVTFSTRRCYRCGLKFPHDVECPAKNKKCHKCGEVGHFEKRCRADWSEKKLNENMVNKISDMQNDDQFLFAVTGNHGLPKVKLAINGVLEDFIVDTGSTVNVIDENTFEKLKKNVTLKKSAKRIFPYKSTNPHPIVGEFESDVKSK